MSGQDVEGQQKKRPLQWRSDGMPLRGIIAKAIAQRSSGLKRISDPRIPQS